MSRDFSRKKCISFCGGCDLFLFDEVSDERMERKSGKQVEGKEIQEVTEGKTILYDDMKPFLFLSLITVYMRALSRLCVL